ncbi:MAG: DUF1266 domain-containing protein [Lachnospiraceae bacterium]|jgi:hypothetical protein|nr:DUF1266 domain-containing protein [Lachnospiraceae bacterium]
MKKLTAILTVIIMVTIFSQCKAVEEIPPDTTTDITTNQKEEDNTNQNTNQDTNQNTNQDSQNDHGISNTYRRNATDEELLAIWESFFEVSPIIQALTSEQLQDFEAANALSSEREHYLVYGAFYPAGRAESPRIIPLMVSDEIVVRILEEEWNINDRESALNHLYLLSEELGQTKVADDVFNTLVKVGSLSHRNAIGYGLLGGVEAGLEDQFAILEKWIEENRLTFLTWVMQILEEAEGTAYEDFYAAFEYDDLLKHFTYQLFAERINRFLDAYIEVSEFLTAYFMYTEAEILGLQTLAAVDYGRVAAAARYSVVAGYLEEEEAWEYIEEAARHIAETYKDWREYTVAYVVGRALSYGETSHEIFDALGYLLFHPDSPFQEFDFGGIE